MLQGPSAEKISAPPSLEISLRECHDPLMTGRVALLITGSELLDGRGQDSCAQYIGELLTQNGLVLSQALLCGDNLEQLLASLHYLLIEADTVIMTGGLGPTSDDLTRDVVARFLGRKLVSDKKVEKALERFFAERQRPFLDINRRQALFPENALILKNAIGTAPGFVCTKETPEGTAQRIIAIPGVPAEVRRMFPEEVLPLLLQDHISHRIPPVTFRIFALPESAVGQRIEEAQIDPRVTISYRAKFPEVIVGLSVPTLSGTIAQEVLSQASEQCRATIGEEFIFSEDSNAGLIDVVHKLLLERGDTVAVGESCTGGLLAEHFTRLPGASGYFLGGAVTYANEAKIKQLGVGEATIKKHGAVSSEVACEMALGARKAFGSSIGLALTGVAGPDGGTRAKPVGSFYLGYASPQGEVQAFRCFYRSDRARIRTFATCTALDLVRRSFAGFPLVPSITTGSRE